MPELLDSAIARHVWACRYRGGPGETGLADSWQRVAQAIAAAEPRDRAGWQQAFAGLLADCRFLPGGRILAGAGCDRARTLFNCFVMGPLQDDAAALARSAQEAQQTLQQGGGIGYDLSTLRPQCLPGALGVPAFLARWDALCAGSMAGAHRRGAMMAALRCDHPDIEAFIDAKRQPGVLSHFNLSVQASDAFLQAVHDDAAWPLLFPQQPGEAGEVLWRAWPGQPGLQPCRVYRRVPARALWQRLLQAAYDSAEPGVLFTDTINRENNLAYCEQLATTNPCGEVPLPAYGACDLGSLNLTRFVRSPFSASATIDWQALQAAVPVAVRFLDNAIEVSGFPLPQQAAAAQAVRRIGLGITGLADALLLLGLHYGSEAARQQAAAILQAVRDAAYRASVVLAREKGAFPALRRDAYLASPFVQRLPADIRAAIAQDGIRNSHLLALAPAGSISLLAGNLSSGIEPVFAWQAERRVHDGSRVQAFRVEDPVLRQWRAQHGDAALPAYFVTAQQLAPLDHLRMQAALQLLVDNAIAKTVNIPADLPFARFHELFAGAHALGLKGLTVFRPTALRGEVLLPASCAAAR